MFKYFTFFFPFSIFLNKKKVQENEEKFVYLVMGMELVGGNKHEWNINRGEKDHK